MVKCGKCGNEMAKGNVMNSGNAKYETFVCKECGEKKTVCSGINAKP